MASLIQIRCGACQSFQMPQQKAVRQQRSAVLGGQRCFGFQQGLAEWPAFPRGRNGRVTMDAETSLVKIVREKKTLSETLTSCTQLTLTPDYHPTRLDLMAYNGYVTALFMQELMTANSDLLSAKNDIVAAQAELVEKMKEVDEVVHMYNDSMEVLLGLAHENGNLVLRVFVEVGLKDMHSDHLRPLSDADCKAYQADLAANKVIQADVRNPGHFLFSTNAQRFDCAKALTHYAQCKTCNYMRYEFVNAANEVVIKRWPPAAVEQEIANAAVGMWKKLHVPHHSLDSSTRVVRLLKDARSSEPELLLYYSMIRNKGVDVVIEEGQQPSPPLELYVERSKYFRSLLQGGNSS